MTLEEERHYLDDATSDIYIFIYNIFLSFFFFFKQADIHFVVFFMVNDNKISESCKMEIICLKKPQSLEIYIYIFLKYSISFTLLTL